MHSRIWTWPPVRSYYRNYWML